jgi:hypothetical protein
MNLLVSLEPNVLQRTDAAPIGLGGYSLKSGIAWCIPIPLEYQGRLSQNFVEYLASVVGIKVTLLYNEIQPGDCVMSLTDNTSAMGWLRKSNFARDGEQMLHFELARDLANQTLQQGFCLSSQWFAGIENLVADALPYHYHGGFISPEAGKSKAQNFRFDASHLNNQSSILGIVPRQRGQYGHAPIL